jgi:hypothetical protein
VRKLVLAALAAWVVLLPSIASAQGRFEGQGQGQKPRPQIQIPSEPRRGGFFSGVLGDIAGARLDRAHADKRSSDRPPRGNDRKDGRR